MCSKPNHEVRDDREDYGTRTNRVGQKRMYTPYMTVYFVKPLPKVPYIHRVYMVLANPTCKGTSRPCSACICHHILAAHVYDSNTVNATHMHAHTFTYTHVHTLAQTHTHKSVQTCAHALMYTHMYIHTYARTLKLSPAPTSAAHTPTSGAGTRFQQWSTHTSCAATIRVV